ncbi:ABC transporter substrate-binding protein [Prauserella flavalba]|uniref:Iron ABC transporter substrate-binding protein n=1 Tax=Prauserella flavalba TaxID=1477506 RepID=A0A318LT26_9PSEU|nr:ABC transporter substrate-binding protein [Prauserella flavalba]PXY37884.1 iron ABC transporter substrate-binding protein [Prauserella flavalba]
MRRKLTLGLATTALLVLTTACGGGGSGESPASDAARNEVLPMPAKIDTSNGLVIDGERIADKQLFEAAKKDKVVLYSGSGKESEDLTIARFKAETGIDIELTRMPTNKLSERVLSEHGANQLGAGVVRVTDPLVAEEFAKRGVYVNYQPPSIGELAKGDNVVFNDGQYLTAYYSAYAFGYNSAAVQGKDVPKKWADLLDPKWKGKLGVVHAGAGGTVTALAAFQLDAFGEDYVKALGAQQPRIFDTTSVQLEALARGEITVATLGFNSTYGAEVAGAPVKLVVPEDGISGSFNLMGLTPAGEKSPAAKLFINWTMSKAGQKFAAAQGFVPARPGLEPTPTGEYQLPPADSEQFHLFTPEDAKERSASTVQTWNQAFHFTG